VPSSGHTSKLPACVKAKSLVFLLLSDHALKITSPLLIPDPGIEGYTYIKGYLYPISYPKLAKKEITFFAKYIKNCGQKNYFLRHPLRK
jgi:hypothetical protein